MAAAGVLEAIDVLKDGGFCLTPRRPALPPYEFRFEGFEEGFDGRIIVAISLAAHRWTQAIGLQLFLIVVRAILAAAIRMEKAALGRLAQAHRHIQRPDRQVFLNPVADCPAHDATAMQIKDDCKIRILSIDYRDMLAQDLMGSLADISDYLLDRLVAMEVRTISLIG